MAGPIDEAFPPGTQFGAYRIVRSLGEGASGAVYEVLKTSVGKRMALKVLHRSLTDNDDDLRRFEREARIGGAIEHPNVVQVFDVGELDGHCFMTMELLEGETLLERLEREGTLSIRDLADLFVPLMSALGAVHDQGIVHRDLKPGNIFLVSRRPGVIEPKLLDFGVVKDLSGIIGGDMTRAHSMVGSPSYMSPEQAEQASTIDVRSDQFTIGSILWECLIGRKLFDGATLYQVLFKIADDPITPPCQLRGDVPAGIDAVVMRALERDPANRFSSAREIGAGLLPHCSEHVRGQWQGELLAGVDDQSGFDDEVTSMRPSLAVVGPQAIAPSYAWAGAMQAPVPTPYTAAPMAPPPAWLPPGGPDASGRFSGDGTFRPAALPAVPPARRERGPWGVVLAIACVALVAVTGLLIARYEPGLSPAAASLHAPVERARPAVQTSPASPLSNADAGVAPILAAVAPAAAVSSGQGDPVEGAHHGRRERNKHPHARAVRSF